MNVQLSVCPSDVIDDAIWMAVRNFNGLLEYNIREKTISGFFTFPGEKKDGRYLVGKIYQVKNELCCIPISASAIYYFSIIHHSFRRVELPPKYQMLKNRFSAWCNKGKNVYLFSIDYDEIIVFNMETEKFSIINDKERQGSYITSACIVNNMLVACGNGRKELFVMDCNSGIKKWIDISCYAKEGYIFACANKEDLLLLTKKECELHIFSDELQLKKKVVIDEQQDEIVVASSTVADDLVWIVNKNKAIYQYSLERETIKVFEFPQWQIIPEVQVIGDNGCGSFVKDKDMIWMIPGDYGKMVHITHDMCEEIPLELPSKWVLEYLTEDAGIEIMETEALCLEEFLKCMIGG